MEVLYEPQINIGVHQFPRNLHIVSDAKNRVPVFQSRVENLFEHAREIEASRKARKPVPPFHC